MTLFEYTAVAASLIASFTAVRLLGGLSAALEPSRRYWVHAIWVVLALLSVLQNWWMFWSFRDVEWNFFAFLLALAPLCINYGLAVLLVPEGTGQVISWQPHFDAVRRRFFALCIAYIVAMVACTVVLLGHPLLHPRRVIPASLIAAFACGAAFGSPRAQVVVLCLYVVASSVAEVIFVAPGSFAVAP